MIRLKELTNYLDSLLNHKSIEDVSLNGIQFPGNQNVKKIAISVDVSLHSLEKAMELNCDFLFVHHGLFWSHQGVKVVDEKLKNYYKILIEANLSLYASHLPLDMHPKYGNNAGFIHLLNGDVNDSFCSYHGNKIGYYSDSFQNLTLGSFIQKISSLLNLKKISILAKGTTELKDLYLENSIATNEVSKQLAMFDNYKSSVSRFAIVSGGGSDGLDELSENNITTFLTGEVPHYSIIKAREENINLIIAGHYKTETVGIKLIAKHLEDKFNLETVFIDFPTGI